LIVEQQRNNAFVSAGLRRAPEFFSEINSDGNASPPAWPSDFFALDKDYKRGKHVRKRSCQATYVIVHILGQQWLSHPKPL